MRLALLLALVEALCAACADEPTPSDALTAEPTWFTDPPENAYPYADETLKWFRAHVEHEVNLGEPGRSEAGHLTVVDKGTGETWLLQDRRSKFTREPGPRLWRPLRGSETQSLYPPK
ncbi:MAG: hypothetical protein JRF61_09815 [Deltaproteobacteria bacterium]|jgi:hypothetical protein|nr:hypothetical protein [Deltaproteobacteria bacterium]